MNKVRDEALFFCERGKATDEEKKAALDKLPPGTSMSLRNSRFFKPSDIEFVKYVIAYDEAILRAYEETDKCETEVFLLDGKSKATKKKTTRKRAPRKTKTPKGAEGDDGTKEGEKTDGAQD